MELQELRAIVSEIECKVGEVTWSVFVASMGDDGFYLQLRYIEPDIATGAIEEQHGRKWYVSSHSCKSEIVRTVLKACLTSAEHMIREHFKYRGCAIFAPHWDVDEMVGLIDDEIITTEHRKSLDTLSKP